jgi:hypothetical protein
MSANFGALVAPSGPTAQLTISPSTRRSSSVRTFASSSSVVPWVRKIGA